VLAWREAHVQHANESAAGDEGRNGVPQSKIRVIALKPHLCLHQSAGHGVLHSFTVLRAGAPEGFEGDLPYALGVVKLEEGVQLLARLRPDSDGDWHSYRCDDRVEFTSAPASTAVPRPCAWFARSVV